MAQLLMVVVIPPIATSLRRSPGSNATSFGRGLSLALKAARARGRKGGRPAELSPKENT
jgi:hypothetical protein